MDEPASDEPCRPVEIRGADGARFAVTPHGGQVVSWTPAGGLDRLWLSPDAACGPGLSIRGGIPVVWPQFSDRGPLPKHGLVRDRVWQLARTGGEPDGPAEAVLAIESDDASRAVWPHEWRLVLHARAAGEALHLRLEVTNTGTSDVGFTAALHAYLRVGDVATASVDGVGAREAEDNAKGRARTRLAAGPLPAVGPVDLAVRDVVTPVRLLDPTVGDLLVETDGLPDRVVWNPGPGHTLADVPGGGEAGFVCVEPAVLTPERVAPGDTWTGRVTFRAG